MSKAGRQVVGIFSIFFGIFNLLMAYFYFSFYQAIYQVIGPVISMLPTELRTSFTVLMSGDITIISLALIGIFWIIIGIGLFLDQEWAAIFAKILAILYLIGSIFTCNCIGFILAIIILYLLKSEKNVQYQQNQQTIQKDNDRRCPNCGRIIPFNSVICPFCGKRFETFFEKKENNKALEKIEEKQTDVKKCPKCSAVIEDDANFCPECGEKV